MKRGVRNQVKEKPKARAKRPNLAPQQLRTLEVFGLFGRQNLKLHLTDNRLVLVGENGSGKSTIVNILYYCLTRQWSRLVELPFIRIRATFDPEVVNIDRGRLRTEIRSIPRQLEFSDFARQKIGPEAYERLEAASDAERRSLQEEYAWQTAYWRHFMQGRGDAAYVRDLNERLGQLVTEQVLFLPTYRRIEQDLQKIFPQVRAESDLRAFHRATPADAGYVELVEFGMRDVAEVMERTMQLLDREFRQDLVRVTSVYLRDVIRGDYDHGQYEALFTKSTAEVIPALLDRVDDKILPSDDRKLLSALIGTIQQTQAIPSDSRVAAHFLVRLVEAHALQSMRESPVREFARVCNSYLSGKRVTFDSAQFKLHICRVGEDGAVIPEDMIPVEVLSSGEKQIVSLFTHIYLSGKDRYYVIIDEPELSISVVWQRKLLEDIVNTGMCSGMVAVTHSPFIFENSLSEYAHSLSEFIQS